MEILTAVDAEQIRALRSQRAFFWLDLVSPAHSELDAIEQVLDLHPAATEDTREWGQLPRLDEYGDHVLLVFFTAHEVDGVVEPVEVHVYVSADWIVTVRRCPTGLDSQRAWLASQGIEDEDEVLYHVLDALADGWDPVVEVLDRRVDDVEAEVLERPAQEHLRLIYRLKQEVTELQRRAGPQRSIFVPAVQAVHRLGDRTEGSRAWLADVEAHLDSIASDLRRISGDLTALTDTFFNSNANRLNRLATRFAVGSVFFLLWTLVTGFFGQNFEYLVGSVQSRGDFLLYGVGSLVVPTVVLAGVLWWKRDSWW